MDECITIGYIFSAYWAAMWIAMLWNQHMGAVEDRITG
jgi:hypothetical protein